MTTIITRVGKGSPLTFTEMDTNLTNLNSAKLEASNNLSDVPNPAQARTNLGVVNLTVPNASVLKGDGTTLSAAVAGTDYQSVLISGTNIKTINSISLLGSGDITIAAGTSTPDFILMSQGIV